MPTMPAKSWTQRDHGQPAERDPRWNFDRDAIYHHIHVMRQRAWVKWRKSMVPSIYAAPVVGLVVKPLDTYENVVAFIPWGETSGHKKIAAARVPTRDGPGTHPDPRSTVAEAGAVRADCGPVEADATITD